MLDLLLSNFQEKTKGKEPCEAALGWPGVPGQSWKGLKGCLIFSQASNNGNKGDNKGEFLAGLTNIKDLRTKGMT